MKNKEFTKTDLIAFAKWFDFVLIDLDDAEEIVQTWIDEKDNQLS